MITDFGNLSIRNINHAWLEAKLTEKHMNFLWECVSKRKKETYKNLAGNLYGSYSLENKDNEKIFYDKIINPLIMNWINSYGQEIFKEHLRTVAWIDKVVRPYLNDCWVNFQHEGDFNPIHDHAGLFSFVIWMKIPTDWKEQKKLPRCIDSTSSSVSNFQFLYTNHLGKIKTYTYHMSPEMEGTMIFFPAKLKHTVYPFYDCKEERISISGNISIKPND